VNKGINKLLAVFFACYVAVLKTGNPINNLFPADDPPRNAFFCDLYFNVALFVL